MSYPGHSLSNGNMRVINFYDKSRSITRVELLTEHGLFIIMIHNKAVQNKALILKPFKQYQLCTRDFCFDFFIGAMMMSMLANR